MTTTTTEPRVWIGCLACYNDGRLVGDWYPADGAGEVTTKDLHARSGIVTDDAGHVRGAEIYGPHEELWVMDHEGFHGLLAGECSPLEAQQIAEELAAVDDPGAYASYWAHVGGERDVATFEEAYAGTFATFEDYAYELADDIDAFGLAEMAPEHRARVEPYIDRDRWARDLLLGGDFFTADARGDVYVFRSL